MRITFLANHPTRRFALAQRQAVVIVDSVRSDQPVEAIWGMMTDAEIMVSGQTATLRKKDLEITMVRLVMELGRVMSDDRDQLGYVS